MTSDRARAYGRVIKTVDDLAAGKLHEPEQAIVREAADAMLFSDDIGTETVEALTRLDDLLDRLVAADRLTPEAAADLGADVEGCGPEPVHVLG